MAFSIRSSRLASVAVASIIAVGVIGVGTVALADEPDGGASAAGPQRHGPHVKFGFGSLLKDSGVTREEVQEGAAAGLTLGEIIDEYGDISAEEAKTNALATLAERLDAAVAEGRLEQERRDEIEANAPGAIDKLLGTVPGEHRGDKPHGGKIRLIAKNAIETVAEVLGTDVASVRERLAGGETIADIAGDQTQAVIDALTAEANAAIDQAVANGRIPEDKAEDAKARAAAAIERLVNEGRPKHHGERPFKRPNAP